MAGFLLNIVSHTTSLTLENGPLLEHLAHLGVLLMLFTVGLKLRLKNVLRPEVVGGGLLHLGLISLLSAPLLFGHSRPAWRRPWQIRHTLLPFHVPDRCRLRLVSQSPVHRLR